MRKRQKIINLFNDISVYAIKQVVSISDEEDLNQLWEYIITVNSESSDIYSYFVNLYELSSRFLESCSEPFFEIIIEQSDEYYYFTVWNKQFIRFARKEWKKRRLDYAYNRKRITLRLSKVLLREKRSERQNAEERRITHFLSTAEGEVSTASHPAYDFLKVDDFIHLMTLSDDIDEYLYNVQRTGYTMDVYTQLRSYCSKIALILGYYEQVDEIAMLMTEFSILLAQHRETFSALRSEQIALIEGFSHNFNRWLKIVFIEGGANLHFMDRSMRADMKMIRAMVEPLDEVEISDLDDIFDF